MKLLIDTSNFPLWPTITKLDLKKITEIKVKTNPKSFTGSRVGVTIANALGFALDIPVTIEV
ncbi:hypothetical protein HY085_01880 [Candidatus Gottesmanbacteria bacterium]|nr:hypothetical protein [Candidatus Gottesmanbacteria bacterium]